MKTFISHSLEETRAIASGWLRNLAQRQGGATAAAIVGLSGHLGAGKTAFVKEVAKELGIDEEITSPTFVLMKMYATRHPRWPRLVHVDAYRLENREELEALQWENLVADPNNLIMIEWPENVGLSAQTQTAAISFDIRGGSRYISLD